MYTHPSLNAKTKNKKEFVMEEIVLEYVKVYAIGDTPDPIPVDSRFRNISVVVEPWNVPVPPENLKDIVEDQSAFVESGATGRVTLLLQPRFSFRKYTVPNAEGVIDLSSPHFLNVGAPVHQIHPAFDSIAGCTHVSIAVIGVPY